MKSLIDKRALLAVAIMQIGAPSFGASAETTQIVVEQQVLGEVTKPSDAVAFFEDFCMRDSLDFGEAEKKLLASGWVRLTSPQ